jgi:hypothetical protein
MTRRAVAMIPAYVRKLPGDVPEDDANVSASGEQVRARVARRTFSWMSKPEVGGRGVKQGAWCVFFEAAVAAAAALAFLLQPQSLPDAFTCQLKLSVRLNVARTWHVPSPAINMTMPLKKHKRRE